MIQPDIPSLPQSQRPYKAWVSQKQSVQQSLGSLVEAIKATDLRSHAPGILGTQPTKNYTDHDKYNTEAIGHPERTASLAVYSARFKNYGAGAESGDHIALAMLAWNCDFPTAVRGLADLIGLGSNSRRLVSYRRVSETKTTPETDKLPTPQWQAAMHQVTEQAQQTLWNTPLGLKAVEYLRSEGYSDEMIQRRGLGFNPKWREVSVLSDKSCWIAPGILYPWQQGETLYGIKIRCPFKGKDGQPDKLAVYLGMRPETQKYTQVTGGALSAGWYGEVIPNTPVIITEGEKDCDNWIRRIQNISVITVGTASNRLPNNLLKALQAASPQYIVLAMDNDAAGEAATNHLQKQLEPLKFPVIIATLPEKYKDVTEFILDGKDVTEWLLNVQMRASQKELSRLAKTNPERLTYFPQGIPDRLRTFILNLHRLSDKSAGRYLQDHAPFLIVFELRQEAIQWGLLQHDAAFSTKQLVELSHQLKRNCRDHSIRVGLEQGKALGFFKILEANKNKEDSMPPDFQKTSSRGGRPGKQYVAVPLAETLAHLKTHLGPRLIEAIYGSDIPADASLWLTNPELIAAVDELSQSLYTENEQARNHAERDLKGFMRRELSHICRFDRLCLDPSTPLVRDMPFTNGTDYRACYKHSLTLKNEGKPISRAVACRQVGIADSSLASVRKRAKVITEQQFLKEDLSAGRDVCQQIEAYAPWATDWKGGRWLEWDGKKHMLTPKNLQSRTDEARAKLMTGGKVKLIVQKASLEWIGTSEEVQNAQQLVSAKPLSKEQAQSNVPAKPKAQKRQVLEVVKPSPVCVEGATPQFIKDQLCLRLPLLLKSMPNPALWGLLNTYGLSDTAATILATHPTSKSVLAPNEKAEDGKRYRRGESGVWYEVVNKQDSQWLLSPTGYGE